MSRLSAILSPFPFPPSLLLSEFSRKFLFRHFLSDETAAIFGLDYNLVVLRWFRSDFDFGLLGNQIQFIDGSVCNNPNVGSLLRNLAPVNDGKFGSERS